MEDHWRKPKPEIILSHYMNQSLIKSSKGIDHYILSDDMIFLLEVSNYPLVKQQNGK